MSTNTESGWTTVGSNGGGWRARAAARGGAGGPSEPPMTRTAMGERSGNPLGGGWGRASDERSGYPSGGGGERSGYPSGGRPMPAAFGGGERDRRNDRLEEQRQRAAADAERKRKEEREAAEAAKRLAKKMDLNDMDEYPSLGGGAGAPKAKVIPKPALDFRAAGERGVVLSAAREAAEEARAREEYYASYSERMEAEERAAHRRRLAQITTRCYDDGFYEHEPPEEDEDSGHYMGGAAGGEDMGGMPEFEDEADEEGEESLREAGAGHRAAGEFNAHLAVNRRRGDKSDW